MAHQARYPGARVWLLAGAVLLPFLAVLGLVNGGWGMELTSILDPRFALAHGPAPEGSDQAEAFDTLKALGWQLQLLYAALVLAVLGLRFGRNLAGGALGGADHLSGEPDGARAGRVLGPGGEPLGAPAARLDLWRARARCSTCRVRVMRGLEPAAAPASAIEAATLSRARLPPDVRLACQTRPTSDVWVAPLLPVEGDMPAGCGWPRGRASGW